MSKHSHLNSSSSMPSVRVNAAEMNRKATAFLRKRGAIQPFRRTAVSTLKELPR